MYQTTVLVLETFLFWLKKLYMYVRYNWWAMAQNRQFLSNTPFCAYFKYSLKTRGCLNPTAHQTTPLIPRILPLMLIAANRLQPTSYGPVHTSLSHFVRKHEWMTTKLRALITILHQTTASLPRMHLFRSTKWGTIYELPSRTSTYISQCLCKYSVHYM